MREHLVVGAGDALHVDAGADVAAGGALAERFAQIDVLDAVAGRGGVRDVIAGNGQRLLEGEQAGYAG